MYGPPHASMNDPTTTTANVQPHHHHLHHHHHHPHPHGTTHLNDDDNDDDVVDCSNGNDSMDNPQSQIRYDPSNPSHSPHALAGGTVLDSVVPALYASDIPTAPAPSSGEAGADQLTLSFQGEVYVFDSVSPEKVQAVLLLLGGYEVPTGIPTAGMTPQGHRNLGDYPGRSSQPQRAASLNRFREKRKERCFDKKIRYTVRKEVALRMQRKKGQFTSSKSISEEPGSSAADGNGSSGQEEQETLCRHCGISSKATPMMRRGPDGPRTLCNACGLKWANKGILRDLSKVPLPMIAVQTNVMKASEPSSEAKVEGTAIPPSNVIMTSSGDN